MSRPGPVARVRARLTTEAGTRVSSQLPPGYQRMGRALVVRIPESLRPWFPRIGALYQEELGARTVLRPTGPVSGEYRVPRFERLVGPGGPVDVVEFGIRYRFDPERVMFARGNRTERHRVGTLTRPGETVVDLFAGIGYFALPAAVLGRAAAVLAYEMNPESFAFLQENVKLNRVVDRVRPILGDHRTVELPLGGADRVFLGYLPSSVPYLTRALALLRPIGGWLHVHFVSEVRDPLASAVDQVRATVKHAGGRTVVGRAREVKPYGPGRRHVVVDVYVVPAGGAG